MNPTFEKHDSQTLKVTAEETTENFYHYDFLCKQKENLEKELLKVNALLGECEKLGINMQSAEELVL